MSVTGEATVGTTCGAVAGLVAAGVAGALAASGILTRLEPVTIGWVSFFGPMMGLLMNWGTGNPCGFYLVFYWETCSKF